MAHAAAGRRYIATRQIFSARMRGRRAVAIGGLMGRAAVGVQEGATNSKKPKVRRYESRAVCRKVGPGGKREGRDSRLASPESGRGQGAPARLTAALWARMGRVGPLNGAVYSVRLKSRAIVLGAWSGDREAAGGSIIWLPYKRRPKRYARRVKRQMRPRQAKKRRYRLAVPIVSPYRAVSMRNFGIPRAPEPVERMAMQRREG